MSELHPPTNPAIGAGERVDQEARFHGVVDGLFEGVLLADAGERILAANPSAARTLAPAHLLGRCLSEVFAGAVDDSGCALAPEAMPFRAATPQRGRIVGLPAAEGRRWLTVNVRPMRGPGEDSPRLVVSFEDITEARRARQQLALIRRAFEHVVESIVITDGERRILFANRAFAAITGHSPESVIGDTPSILRSQLHDAAFYAALWAEVAAKGAWAGEIWDRRRDGTIFPAWLSLTAVSEPGGPATHYVGILSDITERVETERRMRILERDPLTGLPGRNLVREALVRSIATARRSAACVAALFIDLDRFKAINETLGHHVGDEVLVQVAARLRATLREVDVVGRLTGDEFLAIVHYRAGDEKSVGGLVQRLLASLGQPFAAAGQEFLLTPSIGIAVFPADGDDFETLLANADAAMYAAKNDGCASYRFFTPAMHASVHNRLEVSNAVRQALDGRQFVLFYQPQLDARSGALVGVEALIRWLHPERGLVPPADFIPVVEGSHLIIDIGEWVVGETRRQWDDWRARGVTGVPISVNIAAVQFNQPAFLDRLGAIAGSDAHGRRHLDLEVTESLTAARADGAIEKMQRLKKLGFAVSLDDFGAGDISLGRLAHYPFDRLKIDRKIVARLNTDRVHQAMVASIIDVAHSLQLKVIAQGVETEFEASRLREMGCDQFQGFFFARPMSPTAFEAWLAQRGEAPPAPEA